ALEHVISEELESRLDELLGFPTVDPHGHPIPTARLELDEDEHPDLGSVEPGSYTVRRLSDRDGELLRHLDALGMRPGVRVDVQGRIPYGGGVRVLIEGREQIVGEDAAKAVDVA
ncbi:MAG: metal-dependent transcriptional regulator, partial [Actinomycetota bacterium]